MTKRATKHQYSLTILGPRKSIIVSLLLFLGSAFTCQKCTLDPKKQRNCFGTTECYTSCYTATYTLSGVRLNERGCTDGHEALTCNNPDSACKEVERIFNAKSCGVECCKTDNCNNYEFDVVERMWIALYQF